MAITELGTETSGTEDSNDTSYTLAHTLSAGSNRIAIAKFTAFRNDGSDITTTVTYGGVSMTELVSVQAAIGSSRFYAAMFYVKEASLPADGAQNCVLTFGANTPEKALVVATYAGVDQITTWRDNDETSSTAGTSPSRTLTTVAGDWALGCLNIYTGTPTTSDTEDTHAVGAGDLTDCYTSHEVAGGATATLAWTVTEQAYAFVVGALMAAAATSGTASAAGVATTTVTAARKRTLTFGTGAGTSSATVTATRIKPATFGTCAGVATVVATAALLSSIKTMTLGSVTGVGSAAAPTLDLVVYTPISLGSVTGVATAAVGLQRQVAVEAGQPDGSSTVTVSVGRLRNLTFGTAAGTSATSGGLGKAATLLSTAVPQGVSTTAVTLNVQRFPEISVAAQSFAIALIEAIEGEDEPEAEDTRSGGGGAGGRGAGSRAAPSWTARGRTVVDLDKPKPKKPKPKKTRRPGPPPAPKVTVHPVPPPVVIPPLPPPSVVIAPPEPEVETAESVLDGTNHFLEEYKKRQAMQLQDDDMALEALMKLLGQI